MVPNSGFENSCAGAVPCHWSGQGGAAFLVSVTQPQSGSASGLLTMATAGMVGASAQSDCVPVTAGTTYNVGIWYRAPSAVAASITSSLSRRSSGRTRTAREGQPTRARRVRSRTRRTDGSWHAMTGTVTATSILFTPQSANLEIIFECASVCPVGQSAWFDDAPMDTSPLAVTLDGFRAARSHGGVTLRWRTGTEADTLGFNVFRQQGARRVRLNPAYCRRSAASEARPTRSSTGALHDIAPFATGSRTSTRTACARGTGRFECGLRRPA